MPIDPSTLTIVSYPHPVLLEQAKPVDPTNPDLPAVVNRMIELMFKAQGIGLAAPQVGLPWQLFVVHVPEAFDDPEDDQPAERRSVNDDPPSATAEPLAFLNPTLSHPEGPLLPYEEGCLSLPGIRGDVYRPELITITATDLSGKRFTTRAAGLYARCLQHEFDHLQGTLILNRMTQGARLKMRTKIRSLENYNA